MKEQDPDYLVESKKDLTYEEELYRFSEELLGRKVKRYPSQSMGNNSSKSN